MNKLILLLFLFFITSYVFSPSPTPVPGKQNLSKLSRKYEKIGFIWINSPQIILIGFGLVSLLWLFLLHLSNQVKYITFNTNLNLYKKKSNFIFPQIWLYVLTLLLWLLLSEYPEDFFAQFFLHYCPKFKFFSKFDANISKCLARSCFHISCAFIFTDAISPASFILSAVVLQLWCHTIS